MIGESTNRNHMSLYGYFRETTPGLSKLAPDLVILTDAISCDRFTEPVLDRALTAADVENQLGFGDPAAYSLIDILRAAGIHVYWLSNQNRLGLWDNHTALLSERADRRTFVSQYIGEKTSSGPDEALFPVVRMTLKDTGETKVVFVHLMGAHFPYARRYPKEFARYHDGGISDELRGSQVGPRAAEKVDDYDNAVLYNDYVVSTLIEELRNRGGSSSLLYFADHGETPMGRGRDQAFSPGHVEIPMFFWFSEQFRDNHAALVEALKANRRKRFMNDEIFQSALDLIGVETSIGSPSRSLFRREFVERNRKTLSGKVDYDLYPDPIVMARTNMAVLAAKFPELAKKVYVRSGPNRSSLGQAVEASPGVALDLTFNTKRGTFDLESVAASAGLTLDHVLELLRSSGSDSRLLLRLGGLQDGNAALAVGALMKLDQEFRFRERVTLLTPYDGAPVRSLAQLGYTVVLMPREGQAVLLAGSGLPPNGRSPAIVAASYPNGRAGKKSPGPRATEAKPLEPIIVESDVDPSDPGFVEAMSKLNEAGPARAIAIVLPSLSGFDKHF